LDVKISVCIITFNEEESIERCIRSVSGFADEVIVVDSGSDDATGDIVRRMGASFVHQDWLGFVGQKNFAVSLASNEWVFSIDADEEVSSGLREELMELKAKSGLVMVENVVGFSMPRCVMYNGRWIKNGDWYPDRLVRLFRKGRARFSGGKVHERLEVDGAVIRLAGDLHHYSFKDAEDHWSRCCKYAELWAQTQFEMGRRVGPFAALTHSLFRWFRGYILRGGFLDGADGWQIARLSSREVALKYRLLRGKWS
jgi:glycosyltransferase involved in cell wall biosynthesis